MSRRVVRVSVKSVRDGVVIVTHSRSGRGTLFASESLHLNTVGLSKEDKRTAIAGAILKLYPVEK